MRSIFDKMIDNIFVGRAPDVIDHRLIVDSLKPYTKVKITQNIKEILEKHPGRKFKIGKTGDAEVRVDYHDYRREPFDYMYLLYQHSNEHKVSDLEVQYIRKYKALYPERCVNENMNHAGKMSSPTAYFYMYLII